MKWFEGKVALITGGTSGIGLATAKRFAQEGAKVVVAGRDAAKGERALGEIQAAAHPDVLFVPTDVSRAAEVEALVRTAIRQFGRLDCAFNNATSDGGGTAYTHEMAEEDFDRLIGVALKGVWLCMKYEVQQMLGQGGGAIVNTASVATSMCCAGTGVYAAGKSGVVALSRAAAAEYATRGIRVNVLSPGAIWTPMLEATFAGKSPEVVEQMWAWYGQRIALGRVGKPEEAAEAVLWLCSDSASYVTGHTLVVDGGITIG